MWNHPNTEGTGNRGRGTGKRSRGRFAGRGLLAGLIVVVLGVTVAWLLWPEGETRQDAASTRRGRIKEVKAAKGPKSAAEAQSSRPTPQSPVPSPQSQLPNPQSPTPKITGPVYTNKTKTVRGRYAYSKNRAENELAILSCLPVGTPVIGSRDYDETFMADLQQALIEKTEILPDDPEDVKYYKESVIATKKQLREMLKNGEDIQQVLTDTRKQLQDLGVYKMQLEREIGKIQREAEKEGGRELTDDEVKDFVKAANKMLESKGIEPFEFNDLTMSIMHRKPFPTDADFKKRENGEEPDDE